MGIGTMVVMVREVAVVVVMVMVMVIVLFDGGVDGIGGVDSDC